jgi:hypothetical protein
VSQQVKDGYIPSKASQFADSSPSPCEGHTGQCLAEVVGGTQKNTSKAEQSRTEKRDISLAEEILHVANERCNGCDRQGIRSGKPAGCSRIAKVLDDKGETTTDEVQQNLRA